MTFIRTNFINEISTMKNHIISGSTYKTYSSKSSSESTLLDGEFDKPESSDEKDWFNNDALRLITSSGLISMLTLRFLPISDIFKKII